VLDFSATTLVGSNFQINGDYGNDTITGTGGNNIIIGGGDQDSLNGGNGSDDYWVRGYVSDAYGTFEGYDTYADNGTTGSDRIVALRAGNVDIGLTTFTATSGIEIIDGTGATGTVTLLGDGYSNVLDFSATTFVGSNFQINGDWGNDTITGTGGNDIIIGGHDHDSLNGGNGNDTLQGTNGSAGEQDYLVGGTGRDTFILGGSTWIGYDDGLTTNAGTNDYAEIADFNTTENDIIQLQGGLNYLLSVVGTDTQLLIDKPNTEPDELIAIIKNRTGLSLTGSYFVYDQTITLAVAPVTVIEDGTTNLVYTFTRTGTNTNALTVNYSIAGTADATDYTGATPGTGKTITFSAGSATATLTIDPTADTTIEANETVALTLATGTGYTVGTTTGVTGTITNDDFPSITLAVAPTSVIEDGTTNLVYTFTRTGPTTNALTVNYGITGTADATDYTGATPGTGKTITFSAGSATATLTIDPTADTTIEANETVALTLATGTGYTVGTTTAVTGTITNDDFPSITLAVAPVSVSEDGTTNLVYTFTRTGATPNPLTVNYSIAGTADATDYTGATPGTGKTITFAAGSATATLTIDPTADAIVEANETVALTLATGTDYTIGTTTAVTGTITNDDTAIESIGNTKLLKDGTNKYFAQVGNNTPVAIKNGTIHINEGMYAGWQTLAVETVNGVNQVLWTNAGSNTMHVWQMNNSWERVSTQSITLNSAAGFTQETVFGVDANGDGVIGSPPSITLAVAPVSVLEDGTTNLVYTFTRTGATTNALTVNYGITGTADATDYTGATPGTGKTITFNPGSATATLTIDPTADAIVEANETVALTLATGTGYIIGTTTAVTGTITNDDTAIEIVGNTKLLKDGTNKYFAQVGNNTPVAIKNSTIHISEGMYAGWQTLAVETVNGVNQVLWTNAGSNTIHVWQMNSSWERVSTQSITLNSAAAFTQETAFGVDANGDGTIGSPSSITLAVAPASVSEDGTANLVYTFTRTGATTNALTVNYSIAGTADATDYTGATPGTGKTITLNPGSATASLTIDPTADAIVEANETVALTLATGTGYTIGTTTAVTGTITNDDLPTITLDVNFSGISEDSPSNFVYTFTRTGSTTNAITANYSIAGTATATDYIGATPGIGKTITFAAGSATATLTLDPTADTILETDETISLQLDTGTGYTVGTTAAQIAIIINDDGTRRQKGTSGQDVILGTNLGDILSGGLGNDILTGGVGGDSFSFNALNEGIDTITDFSPGNDYLFVKGFGFGGGLVSGDVITAAQFVIGTTATNTSQRFIYNSTNGALLFDVDGNGATAASQFAILSPNLALTYEDIFVI
jgi:Ca2+-binding RTX toxin-like protein